MLSENITPFRDALNAPGVPPLWGSWSEPALMALNGEVTRQALTIAYINDFRFMMYLSLCALPLLLLLRSSGKPAPR